MSAGPDEYCPVESLQRTDGFSPDPASVTKGPRYLGGPGWPPTPAAKTCARTSAPSSRELARDRPAPESGTVLVRQGGPPAAVALFEKESEWSSGRLTIFLIVDAPLLVACSGDPAGRVVVALAPPRVCLGLGLPARLGPLARDRGPLLGAEPVGARPPALEPAGATPGRALGSLSLLGLADGLGDHLMRELVRVARALGGASKNGAGRSQDQAPGVKLGWISK